MFSYLKYWWNTPYKHPVRNFALCAASFALSVFTIVVCLKDVSPKN